MNCLPVARSVRLAANDSFRNKPGWPMAAIVTEYKYVYSFSIARWVNNFSAGRSDRHYITCTGQKCLARAANIRIFEYSS